MRYRTGIDTIIEKYPLLPHDEQNELIVRAQQGDEQARQKVILANLRISTKLAHKYSRNGNVEDLVHEGIFGLNRAIDLFDPSRGNKFITYAIWSVRSSILRSPEAEDMIRLPYDAKMARTTINKAIEAILEKGQSPSPKRVKHHLEGKDYPLAAIERYMSAYMIGTIKELDTSEPTDLLHRLVGMNEQDVKEPIYQREMHELIQKHMQNLTEREHLIVTSIYFDHTPMKVIAEQLGISQSCVNTTRGNALSKLRRSMHYDKQLMDYV